MSDFRAAARYAKSLIDLSMEKNLLEQVHADMQSFLTVFKQNHSLQAMLKSPIITSDKKMAVLNKVFGASFQKLTMQFFEIITRKNRSAYLDSIARSVISQYNDLKNIATATVKSAVALDSKTYDEIKSFIAKATGKNIELQTIVEPKLIGGMVIKIGDKLFDASIAGSLNKAKQELLNTYISK
jgi:F-type H+-transporting ATPase subunit delta